ncbi:hypothetical protein DBV15_01831 [Temnothorax longispinosus]|uniref:Uncharacterized protein n=1 Tax=Temnothorax longispinosus TaxID=300112 RepID=A0A4S2KV73_9HYME|nr:hypothetical protein DBV15_01831 [Temnothorax longispinosus]
MGVYDRMVPKRETITTDDITLFRHGFDSYATSIRAHSRYEPDAKAGLNMALVNPFSEDYCAAKRMKI